MTTPAPDYSFVMAELRDLRKAQQETQVEIVRKLAHIEANVSHYSDIRTRLEALEKLDSRRAGVLAVIATVAGSVASIVMVIAASWIKSALHLG